MRTYLNIIFYSEGANPIDVVERLRSLGFKPLKGCTTTFTIGAKRKSRSKTYYKSHAQSTKH
ncbi:MAG: hypothetical protein QXX51_04845 [Candidatus Bathyarchaeia archaeon]